MARKRLHVQLFTYKNTENPKGRNALAHLALTGRRSTQTPGVIGDPRNLTPPSTILVFEYTALVGESWLCPGPSQRVGRDAGNDNLVRALSGEAAGSGVRVGLDKMANSHAR